MTHDKLLSAWTPDALLRRIHEGEELLVEFETEPPWMSELVHRELVRKRALLEQLRR